MKVTIDLAKLLEFHDEHAYDYAMYGPNGFRAFMMDFLVQPEDEKKRNDDCIERTSYFRTSYFPEVRFKTRLEAESVLNNMKKEVDATGFVTVADYYDYSEKHAESDWYHLGWTNLDKSYVYSVSERGIESFGIHLPKPMRTARL